MSSKAGQLKRRVLGAAECVLEVKGYVSPIELLMTGVGRDAARRSIAAAIDDVIETWSTGQNDDRPIGSMR